MRSSSEWLIVQTLERTLLYAGSTPLVCSAHLLIAQKMQDGEIELPRVLQKREVAHLRLDQQPAVRNAVSHEQRILALDRLVMIRIDDPGRHLDAGKVRRDPVRLRLPHFRDLGEERIVIRRRWRKLFIFLSRTRDERGKNGALIDILDTARVGVRRKRKELREPLGVMDGNVEPDDRAIAATAACGSVAPARMRAFSFLTEPTRKQA